MGKNILLSVVAAGLLLWGGVTGAVFAGIEPVPWQPELKKLHSIELNIAAIQKRLVKLDETERSLVGATNYLNAMGNQLGVLDTRLADTLYLLPSFSQLDTETQGEVLFALDAISADASTMEDIFNRIAQRMGIEPSPWQPILNSITGRISAYINSTLPK